MKRMLPLLILLIIGSPACLSAQDRSITRLRLNAGIKLGANLAKLDGESWESGYRTNLLGGVFARLHNNRVGLQVEAFFSQSDFTTGKNFHDIYEQYYSAAKDSLKKGSFRVNYLNIPLIFQFKVISRVWLQLGPQYSGLVSVKDMDELLKDATGLFKNGTLSGIGGIWIDLPAHLNIGARYVYTFSDANALKISEESWKQKNIQLHLGLTF